MKRPSNHTLSLLQLEKDAWSKKNLYDRGFKKILIVDDCPKTTSLIREYLRDLPLTDIETYNNEFEALKSVALDKPDLIVLDINLEVIDGRKLAHLLKEINCATVPIIFMSLDQKLLKNQEYSLKKPLSKTSFKNYLEEVLMKKNHKFFIAS